VLRVRAPNSISRTTVTIADIKSDPRYPIRLEKRKTLPLLFVRRVFGWLSERPTQTLAASASELVYGQTRAAHAHFFLGRYAEAASLAAMALQDNYQPGLRIAAASNAMAGRPEQAHQAVARLRQVNPTLRVSTQRRSGSF
jgi:hypothetical protein